MDGSDRDYASGATPRFPRLTAPLRSVGLLRPYESVEEIRGYETSDRWSRLLSGVVCSLPFFAACIGLIVASVPVAALKAWVDSLAPDGVATTFPSARLVGMQPRVAIASMGWCGLGGVAFYLRYRFPGPVRSGIRDVLNCRSWITRRLRRLPQLDQAHAVVVMLLTLSAFFAAALLMGQPVRADEASSYTNYVSKHPLYVLCVYSRTNNHVLYNLLAWLSVNVLGDGVFQLRLPSFVAGMLLVPVTYVAARRHHGRGVALLAVAFLASSALVVDGSSNARGYQLMLLAFVTLIAVLPSIVQGRQWAWLVFVTVVSLGFWIVPIMVYPAVIVGLWLMLGGLLGRAHNARTFLVRLAVAVVSIVVIVASLYSPAQVVSQAASVLAEQGQWRMQPTVFGALHDLTWRAKELGRFWHYGRPSVLHWLSIGGVIACPFVAHRTGPYGARLFWSALVGVLGVVAVTRVSPPFWALGFVYLMWVLLAAIGVVGLLSYLPVSKRARLWLEVALAVAVFVPSASTTFDSEAMRRVPWYVGYADAGPVVDEIGEALLTGSHLDVRLANGATLNYYLRKRYPRRIHEMRPYDLEGTPDEVFLLIPPSHRAPPRIDNAVSKWQARGYYESADRVQAGESEIITLRRLR